MTDLAWMKTFIGDEAALTGHLTAEEFGAYERLRRHYWQHGSLPDDDARLCRITGVDPERWEEVRSGICSLFGEGWRLERLDQERAEAADKRLRAIEKSHRAAQARWNRGSPNARSNASSMHGAMLGAMLEQCPPAPAPASDEVRYEEEVEPTRMRAREASPTEEPMEPFPTDDEARTFLKRRGVKDPDLPAMTMKLQAWRLYRSELAKYGRVA